MQNVDEAYNFYIKDGYKEDFWKKVAPEREHFGVWITCFVAFDNKSAKVKEFLDKWYLETLVRITQDQVTFSYVVQKMNMLPYTLPDQEIIGNVDGNKHFIKQPHAKLGI